MTEDSVAVIIERIDNLKHEVAESKIEANEWRNRFMERLDNLPCGIRIEQTKGIHVQLKAIWILVSAILLGIIAEYIRIK